MQLLLGLLGSGATDIMTADTETMVRYAYQGAYVDLSQILEVQQLEQLAPYLIYIDEAYRETLEINPDVEPSYPDPLEPETMQHPIPVAIKMPQQWAFAQLSYGAIADNAAVGLVMMGENRETAVAFLEYLLEKEIQAAK